MLEVRAMNAWYGKAQVLHEISIRVDSGEIVAILGPNGAGKTTLVYSIAGLLKERAGSVTLDDIDLMKMAPHAVSAQGVALVPEGRRMFAKMTVSDNLDVGAYGKAARSQRDSTRAWVHDIFPRLAERGDQLAGTLSGGEQQMLAIGRALMSRPKLLLLDEPSLGLAPIVVHGIFEVLREVNEAGVSILLVEQNVVEALDCASRGYLIEEGRIAGEDSADALLSDTRLRKAYLGF